MILKNIESKRVIHISSSQEEIYNKDYEIYDFSFRPDDLAAIKYLDEELLSNLIPLIDGATKSLLNYNSKEGLKLYALLQNDKVLVISSGEVTSGKYQLNLEGIWSIVSS